MKFQVLVLSGIRPDKKLLRVGEQIAERHHRLRISTDRLLCAPIWTYALENRTPSLANLSMCGVFMNSSP